MYGGLYVDRDGDRFINEKRVADFPLALGGEAVLRQGKVYAVVDSATYEACATEGIYSYMGQPENWKSGTGLWVPVVSKGKEQLQSAIDEGWAYTADTLAECAEYFGLENLEATVAEYNEMCANGEDTLFGKAPNFMRAIGEGPYYVFEYEPGAWSTFG
ncbi:MAG: succinate dehydrogenase, partial [Alphaproteobacteria bacterium]